nr:probable beta-1,3-galactosyltransferase 2 [Ipomoea batatas]
MEDYYGWGNRNRGKMTAENEEFQEEEVWAVNTTERETSPSKVMMRKSSSSWRLPVAPRTGGSHERRCRAEQSSAPVSIPDWSKIYCRKNNGSNMKGENNEGGHF